MDIVQRTRNVTPDSRDINGEVRTYILQELPAPWETVAPGPQLWKIGRTIQLPGGDIIKGIGKRIGDTNTGNVRMVSLVAFHNGTECIEDEMHEALAPFRVKGEWFRCTQEELEDAMQDFGPWVFPG